MDRTIAGLLAAGNPRAAALAWDGGDGPYVLTFAELRTSVERLAAQLVAAGVQPGDRVAYTLPNGPEAGVVFLAASLAGAAAPLNPALRAGEAESAVRDLRAGVYIATAGSAALDIPNGVVLLQLEGAADSLTLRCDGRALARGPIPSPAKDDIALVLQTSGTTARPKTVPLSHANLAASAGNIATTLALTEADRCLNVMPLFHIHGLVGALLSSLSVGASVACSRGFDGFAFAGQLERFEPTWYTAVPTIHQVVAERARRSRALAAARLRFVRSSSSALPTSVLEAIESATGAPMIEAYGMTEASHQMASNPLPPHVRKPGSVGLGGAVDITVLDSAGSAVTAGARGEVAVRGPNVFAGYSNNPEANAAAFTGGWFRTGDEGYLDADGYLSLTGRLKELINRGGEKVSPAEVEDVILRHPAVAEAVVFSLPHSRLGEDVGAAVVLRPGESTMERAIRDHVARDLAEFKVPRRVVFLKALPKGPTGKLQRIGLAARLGLDEAAPGAG